MVLLHTFVQWIRPHHRGLIAGMNPAETDRGRFEVNRFWSSRLRLYGTATCSCVFRIDALRRRATKKCSASRGNHALRTGLWRNKKSGQPLPAGAGCSTGNQEVSSAQHSHCRYRQRSACVVRTCEPDRGPSEHSDRCRISQTTSRLMVASACDSYTSIAPCGSHLVERKSSCQA